MSKRTYGQAFTVPIQKKAFPSNTTGMVMYRKPNQYSLTNPRQKYVAPEKKNIDVAGSVGTAGGSAWSEPDLLNGIITGTGPTQRIGRKIQMKSLILRWQASVNARDQPIRIMIVYDRQPNGDQVAISEIMAATGPVSATDPNFLSNMNLSNSDRFVILADEIDYPPSLTLGGTPTTNRVGKIYRKINLPSIYITPGDSLADISTGSIYVFTCIPNSVVGTGIGYNSRIRYTDV